MFKTFVTLFTEADILFYVLLILSIGLFILELFIPRFSLAGIAGILVTISTFTERCVHGENSSNQIILYMFYTVLIIFVCVLLARMIIKFFRDRNKVKYKVIDGNKVPLDQDGNPNYSFLIGKEGEVVQDLKPTGKVRFEEGFFEVTSVKEYIYSGTYVIVEKIFNGRIVVKRKGK